MNYDEGVRRLTGMIREVLLVVDNPVDQADATVRAAVGVMVTEGRSPAETGDYLRTIAREIECSVHEPGSG